MGEKVKQRKVLLGMGGKVFGEMVAQKATITCLHLNDTEKRDLIIIMEKERNISEYIHVFLHNIQRTAIK